MRACRRRKGISRSNFRLLHLCSARCKGSSHTRVLCITSSRPKSPDFHGLGQGFRRQGRNPSELVVDQACHGPEESKVPVPSLRRSHPRDETPGTASRLRRPCRNRTCRRSGARPRLRRCARTFTGSGASKADILAVLKRAGHKDISEFTAAASTAKSDPYLHSTTAREKKPPTAPTSARWLQPGRGTP